MKKKLRRNTQWQRNPHRNAEAGKDSSWKAEAKSTEKENCKNIDNDIYKFELDLFGSISSDEKKCNPEQRTITTENRAPLSLISPSVVMKKSSEIYSAKNTKSLILLKNLFSF